MAVYRVLPCPSSTLGRSELGMGLGMGSGMGFGMGFNMEFGMGLTEDKFKLLHVKTKSREIQKTEN